MPSSYTASARFVLQATGEGTNVWGTILNSGAFSLIDEAIAGNTTSSTATLTLSTSNGATDQARKAILNYTGSTAGVWTIPSVSKVYQVRNPSAQLTLTNGSNSLVLVSGDSATVATDGTSIWKVQSADFAGRKITNIAAPTSDLDASTKKYVDDTAFGSITNLPGQAGNAGKFLTTDGSTASWGVAIAPATRKTANYTAVSGDRLECDTSGGAFTITLPATPAAGDRVSIWDGGANGTVQGFAGNNLTVGRNGLTINGLSEDATISTRGAGVTFEYVNSTWRVHLG